MSVGGGGRRAGIWARRRRGDGLDRQAPVRCGTVAALPTVSTDHPEFPADTCARLREALLRTGYSPDGVMEALGGAANERAALRHFANVYGVWVSCPAAHLEPGLVEVPCR